MLAYLQGVISLVTLPPRLGMCDIRDLMSTNPVGRCNSVSGLFPSGETDASMM